VGNVESAGSVNSVGRVWIVWDWECVESGGTVSVFTNQKRQITLSFSLLKLSEIQENCTH